MRNACVASGYHQFFVADQILIEVDRLAVKAHLTKACAPHGYLKKRFGGRRGARTLDHHVSAFRTKELRCSLAYLVSLFHVDAGVSSEFFCHFKAFGVLSGADHENPSPANFGQLQCEQPDRSRARDRDVVASFYLGRESYPV